MWIGGQVAPLNSAIQTMTLRQAEGRQAISINSQAISSVRLGVLRLWGRRIYRMTDHDRYEIGELDGKLTAFLERYSRDQEEAAAHRRKIGDRIDPIHNELLGGSNPLLPRLGKMADSWDKANWLGRIIAVISPAIGVAIAWWLGFFREVYSFFHQ